MNTFRLKIAGLVAVALAAIILVKLFWPAEPVPVNEPDQGAEKLYQMALLQKKSGSSTDASYKIMADCCRQILKQYPNSPQAEKAAQLLKKLPKEYQNQYSLSQAEMGFRSPSPRSPKVKKSRRLRQRLPERRPEQYNIPDE